VQHQESGAIPKDAQRAFATYGDMVYRLALVKVQGTADAEDITQDVFLRYVRSAPQTMDAQHEKAWLIRVAINCSKSHMTSAWRRKTTTLPDEIASPVSVTAQASDHDDARMVSDAVRALGDPYRTAIHLFYYEGYHTAEIAQMMSTQDATVRSWLHRARGMLRTMITIDDKEW